MSCFTQSRNTGVVGRGTCAQDHPAHWGAFDFKSSERSTDIICEGVSKRATEPEDTDKSSADVSGNQCHQSRIQDETASMHVTTWVNTQVKRSNNLPACLCCMYFDTLGGSPGRPARASAVPHQALNLRSALLCRQRPILGLIASHMSGSRICTPASWLPRLTQPGRTLGAPNPKP